LEHTGHRADDSYPSRRHFRQLPVRFAEIPGIVHASLFAEGRTMDKSWDAGMSAVVQRRMMQSALRALDHEFGREQATRFSRAAGLLAGNEFANAFLDLTADFRMFITSLKNILADLNVAFFGLSSSTLTPTI
jgi:hypothetical protein